jgi:hypothetical protein
MHRAVFHESIHPPLMMPTSLAYAISGAGMHAAFDSLKDR